MMITIDSSEFSIDAVMALPGGVDTNFVLSGVWNKIPWRVWLHEPTDTLLPPPPVSRMGNGPPHQDLGNSSSRGGGSGPLTGSPRRFSDISASKHLAN
jgi:hypothetical protein